MTNEEKATELGIKYQTPCHGVGDCEFEARQAALEMAEWKDSQPQIIEIFGKRVIVVKDKNKSDGRCGNCALFEQCYSGKYTLCETTDGVRNRHFVEVDENGNEIK